MGRVAVAVISVLVLVGLSPGVAYAHTQLVSTEPSLGTQLQSAPTRVVLTFNAEVEAAYSSAAVIAGNADPQDLTIDVDGGRLVAEVPPAAPSVGASGDAVPWTLLYRVVSVDGHPVSGQVSFSVLPGSDAAAAQDESSAAAAPMTVPRDATSAAEAPPAAARVTAATGPLAWRSVGVLGLLTVVLISAVALAARARRPSAGT